MDDIAQPNPFAPPRAALADPDTFAGGQVLAGRGQRLVAAILDGILVSLIIWPLSLAFGGSLFMGMDPNATPNVGSILMKMVWAMLPGYIVAAVVQGASLHAFGGTLGKKLMGLRIVRTDGSRAGFVRLFFGRGAAAVVPSFVPLLGGLWALVDLLLIFRDSRQCLHDQIADTLVVTAASSMNASLQASRATA